MKNDKCPICGETVVQQESDKYFATWYTCKKCGEFCIGNGLLQEEDREFIKQCLYFFIYNIAKPREKIYGRKKYIFGIDRENEKNVVYLSKDAILSYGPKDFYEKLDCVLLNLESKSRYPGDIISPDKLSVCELARIFFVEEPVWKYVSQDGIECELSQNEVLGKFCNQIAILLAGLDQYVSFIQNKENGDHGFLSTNIGVFFIRPEGWMKLADLHRDNLESKTIFVAMSFDPVMEPFREAIKNTIKECGYEAVLIDQKKYNGQIVPEILYSIKKSRAVVADMTLGNNGAYYEAGYADALGKQVIITCAAHPNIEEVKDTEWGKVNKKNNKEMENLLHFDVRQKNAILWKSREDLGKRLKDRIEATIGCLK